MRLIDADKLIEICRKGWKLFGGEDEKLKHWVDENDIREQPTVEAIPIEFIKQLIEEFDCERGNAIKDTFAHILTGLLEFWEFEQEKEKETSARPTVSLVSGSVKFSDNVTITQINNDISHGNVTAISSVKPDPNLKLVGNKEE